MGYRLYVLWFKVCSKAVERAYEELGHEKPTTPSTSVSFKQCLPHPSKLKKRKRRDFKTTRSTSRKHHHGFDVTAHVAQLKRKQAEFKW